MQASIARTLSTAILGAAVALNTLGVGPVQVTLNDKPLAAPAIVRNGRVLLPFRAIFSALHASVDYNAARHEVHAQRGGDRIFLRVGTHNSVIVADHLFVPVRYISESLGGKVQYDAADRIVFITDPRASMRSALAPRSQPPDVPAVSATFVPSPIPYATPDPNAPAGFVQGLNFYIPTLQNTYLPGDPLNFRLDAPPNGRAYLELCGLGQIPFINPFGSTEYLLDLRVPHRLAGHSCSASVQYIGPLGAQQTVMLPYTLDFAQPATPAPIPTPTPTTSPTPHPTRSTSPVARKPERKATPTPDPTDSPTPEPTAAPTLPPPPRIVPRVSPKQQDGQEPRPRRTPSL